MCRAVGTGHTIWPETRCGEIRTLSCHEGNPNELMMRECDAHGQWKDYIDKNCTCSEDSYYGTQWPQTAAGATARMSCSNDPTVSRERECFENGEWSNIVTGGCMCKEEDYGNVHWYATHGGQEARHSCDDGGIGSGYRRMCNVDGTWNQTIVGECSCPTVLTNGLEWKESPALSTQTHTCNPGAEGDGMTRTCSSYGSWKPIQGRCDCPEEDSWPQTASGYTAVLNCALGAVGTPSIRNCNPGGTWDDPQEGSCFCPSEDWSNYAGTHYEFPETMENEMATMPCVKDPEMNITRLCGPSGIWEEPEGCEEVVYCPAETLGELTFNQTKGGEWVMFMCAGSSSKSYGRPCFPNGQWGEVIGYCECEETTDAIGNYWPSIRSGQDIEQTCAEGYSGRVSRVCSFLGEWKETSNTCTRNMCLEETFDDITWPASMSLTTTTIQCSDGQQNIQRVCNADGEWESVEGLCYCPATEVDEGSLEESPVGVSMSFACSENYTGSVRYECRGLGTWESVDECEHISCPAEIYEGVEWPVTEGGKTSEISCVSSAIGSISRYCRPSGEWSSVVESGGCYCDPVEVNANGLSYIFSKTYPSSIPEEKACGDLYTGSISYRCSLSGAWTDLNNQCKRIQCPGEWVGGLYFNATNSNTMLHLDCDEGALGSGYDRFCGASGQWEKATGECKCPADTVRHVDGHLYNFQETAGGVDVSKACGGDLSGSVSRSCSMLGTWQSIRGECTHLVCPEERVGNFIWPATNSSTEVHMPCSGYQIGSVSRMCFASGIWGNPVNNCTSQLCEVISITRLDNGCMTLLFNTPSELRNVKAQMVPDHSQDLSIINRGRSVRACGMEVNVEYLFFVEYCEDADGYSCHSSCMLDNVYYQQNCYEMQPIDVIDVKKSGEFTTLTFSSKLSECPSEPYALDIAYQCVEGCMDIDEHVRRTLCSSTNGCKAGERLTVGIEDEFPENAVFQVRHRLLLNEEAEETQPYSSYRTFRISDLTRASEVTPSVEFLNSQKVRLHLGDVTSGLIVYQKHIIYVYKKMTGTRRLVDSLFSTVTLCSNSDTVCEETYVDVVVEPGYDYSFTVYSYPIIPSGKLVVSTVSVSVEKIPSFTMTLTPGDNFIIVTLSEAKYPLSGYCNFELKNGLSNPEVEYVVLPKDETISVTHSDLVPNSEYVVSCLLRDEMNLEGLNSVETKTQAELIPTLELVYQSGTIYDVEVAASVNKPCSLYCSLTEASREMTAEELISIGTLYHITNIQQPFLVNLLLFGYDYIYRVSCVAVDGFNRYALQSILITRSNTPYVPELVSSVPENKASDVVAPLSMELTFKYPVTVKVCSSCFFILYNLNTRTSLNLFNSSYTAELNHIMFNPLELTSDTTYQLKASTRELISDTATGAFLPSSDNLITFTSKKFSPVDGTFEESEDLVPIDGTLEVLFNNYLFLNEGFISINSLSISASNKCLQIIRPSETATRLRIPLLDCVGMLRPGSSYIVVLPEGLLRSRDGVMSPRLTHVFQTVNESIAPHVIKSYPEHLDSYIPLDAPLRLYFDQPVFPGTGFVFISEYQEGEYVNSYNIPGSKAVFKQSFPYEVSWEGYLFTLKPYHTYVVSWSEGVVVNAYDQPIAASTAAETIEFESAKSACSADFLAENSQGVFQCTYENDQCVCTQWNLIAMTR